MGSAIKPVTNIYSHKDQKELASVLWRQVTLPGISEKQRQVTRFVLELYNGRMNAVATPLAFTVIGLLSSGDYEQDQMNFII